MFYYNYKWNITFKNCESLCCTPETYNIVHQLYLNNNNNNKKILRVHTDLLDENL